MSEKMYVFRTKGKALSTKQVGDVLGLSQSAVLALIRSGDLTCHRFGGAYKTYESDLEEYINSSKVQPKASGEVAS